ncbi:MAG: hypothetical protein R3C56_10345 [Pirellulaceae bacterium]
MSELNTCSVPWPKLVQRLGSHRSLVVRGEDGVDEIGFDNLHADARSYAPVDRGTSVESRRLWLAAAGRDALFADEPVASAACIRDVLDGKLGACRDVVVINAAAGLWVAGVHDDLRQCARRVQEALDAGACQTIARTTRPSDSRERCATRRQTIGH